MKLIVLGSGTCVPCLKRNAPGYYLELPDKEILIDCGSGSLLQLEKAGKSYRSIDAVFITHTHPDHISDLVPLIQALLFTPGFKREKDLLLAGPKGFKNVYEHCISSLMNMPKVFHIKMVEMEERLDLGPLSVLSARTIHAKESLAYRFEKEGKSLVITGDCDYDKDLIGFSEGADLLVIDCSFPDALKVKGHLTPSECGLIAKKAGVKRLLLSHIYPSDQSDEERLRSCMRFFEGDARVAQDLMQIEVIPL